MQRLLSLWAWRLEVLSGDPQAEESAAEAAALWWLLRTPHLPAREVLRLGARTVELARGGIRLHTVWDRLMALAELDADAVFGIVEVILDAEMRGRFFYFSPARLRPFLEQVLRQGAPEVRSRARRLVHRLGGHGLVELGELLTGAETG